MDMTQAKLQAVDSEICYDLRRACEERARALAATNISARAAHHELARAYEQRIRQRDPQLIELLRQG